MKRGLVGVVAAAIAVVGCGIAPEDQATRIEPADVPFGLLVEEPPDTEVTQGEPVAVYLAVADGLVAVNRSVATDASLAELLDLVVSGPTEAERALGVTTAVPRGSVASVNEERGVAEVDLTTGFGDVRSDEQLLALAQLVFTLTDQPGLGGVQFTLDGEPVEIPLADGTVQDGIVSRDDFVGLAPP